MTPLQSILWIVTALLIVAFVGMRRKWIARPVVQASPKGVAGLAIAVLVVLAVLALNAMDFADWEDSDYISVIDLGFFLLALGWMLWPRQPEG